MKYPPLQQNLFTAARRSPCGERGLKYDHLVVNGLRGGRSPCGERGLKFLQGEQHPQHNPSLPVRGAWIEIEARIQCRHAAESLPVRGAWIEMTADAHGTPITLVAPRAGSVD